MADFFPGGVTMTKSRFRPAQHPDVQAQALDNELVLYDSQVEQAHVLNPTAARIWELLDGSRTATAVARTIASEYDVTYTQAKADTQELIERFRVAGLLVG